MWHHQQEIQASTECGVISRRSRPKLTVQGGSRPEQDNISSFTGTLLIILITTIAAAATATIITTTTTTTITITITTTTSSSFSSTSWIDLKYI